MQRHDRVVGCLDLQLIVAYEEIGVLARQVYTKQRCTAGPSHALAARMHCVAEVLQTGHKDASFHDILAETR